MTASHPPVPALVTIAKASVARFAPSSQLCMGEPPEARLRMATVTCWSSKTCVASSGHGEPHLPLNVVQVGSLNSIQPEPQLPPTQLQRYGEQSALVVQTCPSFVPPEHTFAASPLMQFSPAFVPP